MFALTAAGDTATDAGYLQNGDVIVRGCGALVKVERWEWLGKDVAVFNGGERYLYGVGEAVTIQGDHRERVWFA